MRSVPMTLPRRPRPLVGELREVSGRDVRRRRRVFSETSITFGVSALAFLAVAGFLIHENIIFTDATSRVANAFFVLFSRNPHLPAMGFVWSPLPSLVLLPILPLKSLLPGLVLYSAAGAVQSALSMAGATAAIGICLRKLGVARAPRLLLVMLFAGQPMILLYGGSGQSEPMMIFFLVMVVNAMISWIQTYEIGYLVGAGVWLGLAYLTRYETLAAAAGVMVLVGLFTSFRTSGTRQYRFKVALNDMALVILPFLFTFVLWAASARILVGEWFPTLSSKYGNSAQVAAAAHLIQLSTGTSWSQISGYLGQQTLALAPLAGVVLLLAVAQAIRKRNVIVLVPIVVLGSVMTFCGSALLMGSSFGWLRFEITVIPMTILLAGVCIGGPKPSECLGSVQPPRKRAGGRIASAALLVAVAVAWPVQARVLTDPAMNLAREEAPILSDVFYPNRPGNDMNLMQRFQTEHQISAYLGGLLPGTGTVLTDSAFAFSIITSSPDPHIFVISSDFDFKNSVNNPVKQHIKYFLVRSDADSDEVQLKWPAMYANGNGIARLVRSWTSTFGEWRLYRLK